MGMRLELSFVLALILDSGGGELGLVLSDDRVSQQGNRSQHKE